MRLAIFQIQLAYNSFIELHGMSSGYCLDRFAKIAVCTQSIEPTIDHIQLPLLISHRKGIRNIL